MSFCNKNGSAKGAEERERGCTEGLAGIYGNRDKKTEHSSVSHSGGSSPSTFICGHSGRGDGVGDRDMALYGAEGNPTCTITLHGTSITDGDLQLPQKATQPKPSPSHAACLLSGTQPAVSKSKQKEMDNFFNSPSMLPPPPPGPRFPSLSLLSNALPHPQINCVRAIQGQPKSKAERQQSRETTKKTQK